MENVKPLNPEREPLTEENVRAFEGFENISDKEAEDIVYSIRTLCRIVSEYMMEENSENLNTLNQAA